MTIKPTLHEIHEEVKLHQAPNRNQSQGTETLEPQVNVKQTTKTFQAPARVITNNTKIVPQVLNEREEISLNRQKDQYVNNEDSVLET